LPDHRDSAALDRAHVTSGSEGFGGDDIVGPFRGKVALTRSTLNRRLQQWLADCDIRDASGQPVKITAHQFRHTVGTRMINNEVSLDVVQRTLDHGSPEMTARYATIKDQTLRANGSASSSASTSAVS
jgi:integrase